MGTLVALEPPAPRLRAELLERLNLDVSQAQAERALAAEISYYRAHLEEGRDARSLARLRLSCAEVLAAELERARGRPVPGGEVMVEVLMASLSFRVFDDVPSALDELARLGCRLVVVSNWDISLPEVLGRLGLTRWLDGIVTSAEVGAGKPDPAAFNRGLAVARVSAEQAVHVGDSPHEDLQGARAAGIEAVLISRGGAAALPGGSAALLGDPAALPGGSAALPGDPAATAVGRQVRTIHSLRELPGLVSGEDG